MDYQVIIITALLSLAPISELRGAIPYAYANHISLLFAYFFCVTLNALIVPIVYIFLSTFNKLFLHIDWYKRFFEKIVEKARYKIKKKVDKYGYAGIMLFVAIPFPVTGAYTGTLGAWILGMDAKKTFLAALGGVIIAGIIVSAVVFFGVQTFSFLIKKV